MATPSQPEICGEPMNYPVPLCTRPPGHSGEHTTQMIPGPLSALAARMVSEADALEVARHAADGERAAYAALARQAHARERRVTWAAIILVSAYSIALVILWLH